ncbi:MAG: ribonuclease P protein component, partial [Clostridia bacterium]|nr:ribonuclease P protein component [Clostridia bacterium]
MNVSDNIRVINKNNFFKKIYAKGRYFISPALVTYVMKGNKNRLFYGITASKKVGNAVKRNRAKRVIRANINEVLPCLENGYCIVFVARNKTPYEIFTFIYGEELA